MAETYCGKSCVDCVSRHELDCPGCKYGPGTRSGGCSIAKCCIDSGHSRCETCTKLPYCQTIKAKDVAPEFRLKRLAAQRAEAEELARRAPVLGENLWILFWVAIASIIMNSINQMLSANLFTTIASMVISIISAFCYWRMRELSEYYKKCFYCMLAAIVIDILIGVVGKAIGADGLSLIAVVLLIPGLIVSFAALYFQFNGHSEQTRPVDSELADKWLNIWKWYIYGIAALIISTLLFLLFNILGLFLLLASAIGLLVVAIMQLKCLYDTANLFRDIDESNR